MVTGENQHVLRVIQVNKADVLVNGIGRAFVPDACVTGGSVGRQHVDTAVGVVQIPGLAVAQIRVELERAVLGQNPHSVNAGIDAVGEREVDDAVFAAEGEGWLCNVLGQRVEPAALTAGQQHGDTFFFHQCFTSNADRLGAKLSGTRPLAGI